MTSVTPQGRSAERSASRLLLEFAATGVFCLVVAMGLAVAFDLPFGSSLLVSNCIGFSIHGLAELLSRVFGARLPPLAVMLIAVPAGILIGYLLAESLLTGQVGGTGMLQTRSLMLGALFGLLGATLSLLGTSVVRLRDSLRDEQLERLAGEKAMAQTELRLLQAQIEPHFLFNTLSNALVLVRTDAEAAARVLEQLTRLLRASLQRTRSAHSTLGEELEVIEAYLSIASVRMGDRLDWKVEVSEDLRSRELPPLLLQPLVENAVQHGIDPLPAGGTVRVVAKAEAETMTLSVRDTGVGLIGQASGSGLALDNIRQRLRALYGAAATLDLIELPDGGTEARVRLPTSQHSSRAQA